MATIVRMPEVLANSTEAALQTWLVQVGETVAVGQPLAEIETEKAIVEYNAEVSGVLVTVLVQEGDAVEVGAPIGVIAAAGETPNVQALLAGEVTLTGAPVAEAPAPVVIPAEESVGVAPVASAAAPAVVPASESRESASETASEPAALGGRRFVSPLVRRLAKDHALGLDAVTGSGPNGRIVRRDVESLLLAADAVPVPAGRPETVGAAPTPVAVAEPEASTAAPRAHMRGETSVVAAGSPGFTDIPHTGMRRAIARRLTESKSTVPHFYITADCRVDSLFALRREINSTSKRKISVNDFVIKAVAGALQDVPAANVIWTDTATRRFDSVDLAVAVSTDGGLLTPVLRGVNDLSLTAVSAGIAALAARARDGQLRQHELEGGSFAVSNLGMFGVEQFSAILNPPQAGILAVGAATARPVVDDGQLAVGTVMTVTLSADHRVVDGAVAAEWMASFVQRIEHPLSILI